MVMATYSIVRATLNSEEVDQQCVVRCVMKHFLFICKGCLFSKEICLVHRLMLIHILNVQCSKVDPDYSTSTSSKVDPYAAGSCAKEVVRFREVEKAQGYLLN